MSSILAYILYSVQYTDFAPALAMCRNRVTLQMMVYYADKSGIM